MDVNEDAVVEFQRFFVKVSHPLFYVQISLTPVGSRAKAGVPIIIKLVI